MHLLELLGRYPILTNKALLINGLIQSNKKLKPANTTETAIGINSTFLNNFEIEIVRSWAKTEGVFFKQPVPAYTGYRYQWKNAANTSTDTWEITLGSQLIKNKNIDWNVNLTYDHIAQMVTKTIGDDIPLNITVNNAYVFLINPNTTVGSIYGYQWVTNLDQMKNQLPEGKTINDYTINSDGYVIPKGSEGTFEVNDINGNTVNEGELPTLLTDANGMPLRTKIGDSNPDFNLSLFSKFSYKQIGLTMLWNWKKGGDIYNLTKQYMFFSQTHGDVDQNGKASYEKKTIEYYNALYDQLQFNKHFVEDGTYLKLRELSVFFNMSAKNYAFLNKLKIQNIKFSTLGRNLLTFTKYTGWDPEVSAQQDDGSYNSSYALDNYNYPNYRSYSFSIELTF
jgi:hypothetical protein